MENQEIPKGKSQEEINKMVIKNNIMLKKKPSLLTISLILFTIGTFINAYGYEKISPKLLWDSLIFIFLFLAIISWKIDRLERKK